MDILVSSQFPNAFVIGRESDICHNNNPHGADGRSFSAAFFQLQRRISYIRASWFSPPSTAK